MIVWEVIEQRSGWTRVIATHDSKRKARKFAELHWQNKVAITNYHLGQKSQQTMKPPEFIKVGYRPKEINESDITKQES